MSYNLAIIPARAGSKRIPSKNTIQIYGKPLIYWCLNAALNCKKIDDIIVSTDCNKVKKVCDNLKVNWFDRPKELCDDFTSSEDVIINVLMNYSKEVDNVIFLQATSPYTENYEISEALQMMNEYDSIVSVVPFNKFLWYNHKNEFIYSSYNYYNRPRSQDMEENTFVENGAFYITKAKDFILNHCRLNGKIGLYKMPPYKIVELDYPEDIDNVENIMKRIYNKDKLCQ